MRKKERRWRGRQLIWGQLVILAPAELLLSFGLLLLLFPLEDWSKNIPHYVLIDLRQHEQNPLAST
eukprot:1156637-Pelagomonas_calceolata.AAC.2